MGRGPVEMGDRQNTQQPRNATRSIRGGGASREGASGEGTLGAAPGSRECSEGWLEANNVGPCLAAIMCFASEHKTV